MILITRPMPEAALTADWLETRGHKALVDPMLIITPLDNQEAIGKPQAILFTSINGVRYAPQNLNEYCEHAFTVGDNTTAAAKGRGFRHVHNAQGTVDDLFDLCMKELDPHKGVLIHYTGTVTRGNLVERLQDKGFQAESRIVYQSLAQDKLSAATLSNLAEGAITSALFFSPRTAKIFVQNLERHGLGHKTSTLTAYCMSEAVAAELKHKDWARIVVAPKPDQESLLASLG